MLSFEVICLSCYLGASLSFIDPIRGERIIDLTFRICLPDTRLDIHEYGGIPHKLPFFVFLGVRQILCVKDFIS